MTPYQALVALVAMVVVMLLVLRMFVRKAQIRAIQLQEIAYLKRAGFDCKVGRPDSLRRAIHEGLMDRKSVVPGVNDTGDVLEVHVRNFLAQAFTGAMVRAETLSERHAIRELAMKLGAIEGDS